MVAFARILGGLLVKGGRGAAQALGVSWVICKLWGCPEAEGGDGTPRAADASPAPGGWLLGLSLWLVIIGLGWLLYAAVRARSEIPASAARR